METSLRLILLAIGLIIVVGILWDSMRDKKGTLSRRKRSEKLGEEAASYFNTSSAMDNTFEEVVVVKPSKRNPSFEEPESSVVALYVMCRQPGQFLGKRLVEAFEEAHLVYGDREIFHQYETMLSVGEPFFSVASAVEPGIFPALNIETFTTPGIILFFTKTRPNLSIAAFEAMLRTAKQLANRLDGELKDERRRPLTHQAIERYRDNIRRGSKSSAAMAHY